MKMIYSKTRMVRYQEAYSELLRKSIHMAVALVALLASFDITLPMPALAAGTLFYSWAEGMRLAGYRIPVVTAVTCRAARGKDGDGMVMGPVTLAIGAMLALMLYPDPVSTIAIYALAFGDGFASLVGRVWGSMQLSFNPGKTMEGSIACFIAVYVVTAGYFSNPGEALVIAATATLIESAALGDMDNILMPFGVGLAAMVMLL